VLLLLLPQLLAMLLLAHLTTMVPLLKLAMRSMLLPPSPLRRLVHRLVHHLVHRLVRRRRK
jgi:hypothetical protein